MPSTSYQGTGAILSSGGFNFSFNGRVNYDTPTRVNNTVTFNDVSTTIQYTSSNGGSSFTYGTGWDAIARIPAGTDRSSGFWSGTRSVGNTNQSGDSGSFGVTVTAGATTVTSDVEGRFRNDAYTNSANVNISIPSLGSPTASMTLTGRTADSLTFSWAAGGGTNGTISSDTRRLATDVGFSTGVSTASLGTGTSGTGHAITSLTSNTNYWVRNEVTNGGGLSTNGTAVATQTLPVAAIVGTITPLATTADVEYSQALGGSALAITVEYRLKPTAGAYGDWTAAGASPIALSSLLPNTDYTIQVRSTTSAGTTTGLETEFTTLPAGKIIMPNGDVINAVPHVIYPNGDVVNVNITMVE